MTGMVASFALPAVAKHLPWKAILIGGAVLAVVGLSWWGVHAIRSAAYEKGKAEVQALWDADMLAKQQAYTALVTGFRLREQGMNAAQAVARQEREHDKALIAAIQRRISSLLRNRPERPTDMSDSPAAIPADQGGPQCTGAGLFRADGEFLERQAARADELRSALKECYAWHDSVLRALAPDAASR